MLASFISSDPISPTLLLLAVLWLAAKLGGELAIRLSLPAVTGELGVGIALAALHTRIPVIPDVAASPEAEFLGTLGIIVLMFAVGLESTVPQMMRIGLPAMRVAVVGVIAPALASIAGTWCLLPQGTPPTVDLFIGSCLCATSIGISVKVLREKSASSTTEGRVIVGAAVIDDVLGLLVLVAVTSIVTSAGAGEALPWSYFMKTLGLAVGFLALALTLGRYTTSILFNLANRFRSEQILLPICLGFAFLLAWLGNLAGLAPIVGAYSAGLILEPAHIRVLEERELHQLDDLIHPLVVTLSPLFFVLMGGQGQSSHARGRSNAFPRLRSGHPWRGWEIRGRLCSGQGLQALRDRLGHGPTRRGWTHLRGHRQHPRSIRQASPGTLRPGGHCRSLDPNDRPWPHWAWVGSPIAFELRNDAP